MVIGSMDKEYAERHELFVSHLHGTTFWEIQLITSIGPLSILLRNLAVPWLFPTKNFALGSSVDRICKLLLDYLFAVVPTLLALTILSERIASLVVLLLVSCAALTFFCLCEYFYIRRERAKWKDVWLHWSVPSNLKPHFITYFRAYILMATAICILAVDFPCFPRRFAKTETWGYGFMDTGVGIIVVANGIVASEGRQQANTKISLKLLSQRLSSSLPLVLMGVMRLVAVKMSGYHEHVSEYGVHWNFFFTLASIKIAISLIACFVPLPKCCGILALLTAATHEYSLQVVGLQNLIVAGRHSSTVDKPINEFADFFNANREGIVSLVGYLALYLAGLRIGSLLLKQRSRLKDWLALLAQLISYSFVSYLALNLSEVYVGEPSRQLINLTYCVWIIFLCFSHLSLFLAVEILVYFGAAVKLPIFIAVPDERSPFDFLEPCLWHAVNKRGLFYFVAANLLTGAVNFMFHTLDAEQIECVAFLSLYTFVLSTLVYVQHAKSTL